MKRHDVNAMIVAAKIDKGLKRSDGANKERLYQE